MRCDVVAIGTELLLGQITDTNSQWIGEQLAAVGVDSLLQVKVGDKAHVGFIDAHAKGVGRHENTELALAKIIMDESPFLIGEPGMVIADRRMGLPEPAGDFLDRPACGAINHNGAGFTLSDQSIQLRQLLPERRTEPNGQGQIVATESGYHRQRIAQGQSFTNVCLDPRRRRRRQRQTGRIVELLSQTPELHVVGSKIMSPLRDAMRFIDDQKRYQALPNQTQKPFVLNPFRSHIEKFETLEVKALDNFVSLLLGQTGVERGSGYLALLQTLDLILHQGDER